MRFKNVFQNCLEINYVLMLIKRVSDICYRYHLVLILVHKYNYEFMSQIYKILEPWLES